MEVWIAEDLRHGISGGMQESAGLHLGRCNKPGDFHTCLIHAGGGGGRKGRTLDQHAGVVY